MRGMRLGLLLLLMLGLGACGDVPSRDPPPPPPQVPSTPEAALAWVREAAEQDDAELLRARLAAWPLEADAFREAEETRVVLTWRIRVALQDGEIQQASEGHGLLYAHFDGNGVSPEGHPLSSRVLSLGIYEEALAQARARIEGPRPDPKGALDAVHAGLGLAGDDDALHERARATLRWVQLERAEALLEGWQVGLPTPSGPRVLVFADDFTLGEAVFRGVLERWQRDAGESGLRVLVVPVLRGQVRMGLRLIPAESREAERASIGARCTDVGLTVAIVERDGLETDHLAELGMHPQDVAILVLDAQGRIVGRLSGTNLDPRPLDSLVQKLVSR